MQRPTSKKPAQDGSSTESEPEAKATKTAPEPAMAKPVEAKPTVPSSEAESHTRSC